MKNPPLFTSSISVGTKGGVTRMWVEGPTDRGDAKGRRGPKWDVTPRGEGWSKEGVRSLDRRSGCLVPRRNGWSSLANPPAPTTPIVPDSFLRGKRGPSHVRQWCTIWSPLFYDTTGSRRQRPNLHRLLTDLGTSPSRSTPSSGRDGEGHLPGPSSS